MECLHGPGSRETPPRRGLNPDRLARITPG
jgi:hypothetical protein